MPPKKSRRLPGGRVRRPGGGAAGGAYGAPGSARDAELLERDDLVEDDLSRDSDLPDESVPVSLEDFRVAPPVAAQPVVSTPRRGRERLRARTAQRTGPTSMDLAARNYGHLRGDLIRIAIIALVMFGIIVALSFVLE